MRRILPRDSCTLSVEQNPRFQDLFRGGKYIEIGKNVLLVQQFYGETYNNFTTFNSINH